MLKIFPKNTSTNQGEYPLSDHTPRRGAVFTEKSQVCSEWFLCQWKCPELASRSACPSRSFDLKDLLWVYGEARSTVTRLGRGLCQDRWALSRSGRRLSASDCFSESHSGRRASQLLIAFQRITAGGASHPLIAFQRVT